VDNLLRPYLVGKSTRMPDFIVLLSTLGGIAIFGLNGLVVGPLIAAMFFAAWDIAAGANSQAQASEKQSQKT
jgi:predicted PurR-regulated permease PerM